uniref:Ig-like domain-containing protein n=1 Tax=Neovison vison TaxID=452646 RepID=A0A8C7BVT4_NEOVI
SGRLGGSVGVRGMTVEQSPSALTHQEGASFTLQCNFSQTAGSVQWFRQHPGGSGLTRLFYIASGMQQSGRLNCTVNTRERSSTLHIGASQLEDSATYLCAQAYIASQAPAACTQTWDWGSLLSHDTDHQG